MSVGCFCVWVLLAKIPAVAVCFCYFMFLFVEVLPVVKDGGNCAMSGNEWGG